MIDLYDKNDKKIEIGSKIRDDMGVYTVKLGSFERDDNDELVAYGNNGIDKLLWPERAKSFELID